MEQDIDSIAYEYLLRTAIDAQDVIYALFDHTSATVRP